jgi:hypothetical protein
MTTMATITIEANFATVVIERPIIRVPEAGVPK